MELISEILTIAYGYSKGTHQRADYLTGEGSWFGMTVLGIMLAVVIYWAVWNIKAACQKKKDEKKAAFYASVASDYATIYQTVCGKTE